MDKSGKTGIQPRRMALCSYGFMCLLCTNRMKFQSCHIHPISNITNSIVFPCPTFKEMNASPSDHLITPSLPHCRPSMFWSLSEFLSCTSSSSCASSLVSPSLSPRFTCLLFSYIVLGIAVVFLPLLASLHGHGSKRAHTGKDPLPFIPSRVTPSYAPVSVDTSWVRDWSSLSTSSALSAIASKRLRP